MSVHREQIESVLKRSILAVISRGLSDPRIRGMISVTDISVSPDKTQATVLISVMPKEDEQLTLHGLRNASSHIRSEVGRIVRMRRVPQLSFRVDQTLKRMSALDAELIEIRKEDGPHRTGTDDDSPPEEHKS